MSYESVVLADSPVGYWPLNETSGTVAHDLSGNGYNGTYEGTYTLTGSGVSLANGFINIPNLSQITSSTPSFTLEGWFKSSTTGTRQTLISLGSSATDKGVYLFVNTSNALETDLSYTAGPTGASSVVPSSELVLGHVVFTNGSAQLYINGTASGGAIGMSPALIQNGNNQLGQSGAATAAPSTPFYFFGTLRRMAVYDAALTAAQIQIHYNAGISTGKPRIYAGGGTDANFLLIKR